MPDAEKIIFHALRDADVSFESATVVPAIANALREAGMLTETEWEYGRAKPGWPVPHVDVLSDTPGNVEYQMERGFTIFRRRKPGPWELVPEEAADA